MTEHTVLSHILNTCESEGVSTWVTVHILTLGSLTIAEYSIVASNLLIDKSEVLFKVAPVVAVEYP